MARTRQRDKRYEVVKRNLLKEICGKMEEEMSCVSQSACLWEGQRGQKNIKYGGRSCRCGRGTRRFGRCDGSGRRGSWSRSRGRGRGRWRRSSNVGAIGDRITEPGT